jgi:hypothetical protein
MTRRDRERDTKSQREWRKKNPFKFKCSAKRQDCAKRGILFSLTPEYLEVIWTGRCPVLEVDMDILSQKDNLYAPQLDRVDPKGGYVEGNVVWLSRRANNIKGNATVEELEAVVKWMKEKYNG